MLIITDVTRMPRPATVGTRSQGTQVCHVSSALKDSDTERQGASETAEARAEDSRLWVQSYMHKIVSWSLSSS